MSLFISVSMCAMLSMKPHYHLELNYHIMYGNALGASGGFFMLATCRACGTGNATKKRPHAQE